MTSIDGASMRTPVLPSAVNGQATPTGDPHGPQVLRWDGEAQGWWSRNGTNVGVGAFGGLLGSVGAFGVVARYAPQALGASRGSVFAGIAAAAIGVGLAGAGISHLVRQRGDRVPELPGGSAPVLPAAVPAPDVHGGEAPAGTHIGEGEGSYREQVAVQKSRYRDGQWETYTDYEWRTRWFDWDVATEDQVGPRDGYPTVDAALEDLARGDGLALRRQHGRIVAYDLEARSHWGDLDELRADDPATQAIVSPGGDVWERIDSSPYLWSDTDVERPDPTDLQGRTVGEHELRHRGNVEVSVGRIVSGRRGFADIASALGDMQARSGEQLVVEANGRYHVADADSRALDRRIPNDGFVTTRHAGPVVAIEQQGGIWSPMGAWYVEPEQG